MACDPKTFHNKLRICYFTLRDTQNYYWILTILVVQSQQKS